MATFQDVLGGLTDDTGYKAPCRIATTADLGTALTGTPVIDGIQTVIGDRILVWQQVDQTTNGVYTIASGAWSRAIDFSSSSSILRGTQVYNTDGTEYGGSIFECLVSNPVVGTTAITFGLVDNLSQDFFNSLPTTLPPTRGIVWNNNGSICIS